MMSDQASSSEIKRKLDWVKNLVRQYYINGKSTVNDFNRNKLIRKGQIGVSFVMARALVRITKRGLVIIIIPCLI